MIEKIKVSVILPVYNVERYLRKCIEDILNQTLQEIELICIDDGSTDGSKDILNEYEKKDARVIVLEQKNMGAAKARNRGFFMAAGKYVSFLDADDFYEKEMLSKAYEAAENNAADITIFRGDRYDDTKKSYVSMDYSIKKHQLPENNPFSYQDIPNQIFTFAVGWAWDKLYLREFVLQEKLVFQELRTSNDLSFVFSSFVKAQRIFVMEELFVHHRIHVQGSLSVTREKSWNCFFQASSKLQDELIQMGIYEEVEKGFTDWVLHFCFWNLDSIQKGSAYEKIYDCICTDCSERFGFFRHDRDYYAQPELYDRLLEMKDLSCVEYLLSVQEKFQEKEKELKKRIRTLEQELQDVRESTSFRTGRFVTAVPRKLKALAKGEKNA